MSHYLQELENLTDKTLIWFARGEFMMCKRWTFNARVDTIYDLQLTKINELLQLLYLPWIWNSVCLFLMHVTVKLNANPVCNGFFLLTLLVCGFSNLDFDLLPVVVYFFTPSGHQFFPRNKGIKQKINTLIYNRYTRDIDIAFLSLWQFVSFQYFQYFDWLLVLQSSI